MTLTEQDVSRLAALARIAMTPERKAEILGGLNNIFSLIEQLQAAPTQGVEPLAHPLSAVREVELRLRADVVTETASAEHRASLMANAPATHEGLFLVPKVIE